LFIIKFFHVWQNFLNNGILHFFFNWKDYELMFYFSEFFKLIVFSYAKLYSSTSLLFVNILLFSGLFALRNISSKTFLNRSFHVFWCNVVLVIVNYCIHHHIHLKYENYIRRFFRFFQYRLLHSHRHLSMKRCWLFNSNFSILKHLNKSNNFL